MCVCGKGGCLATENGVLVDRIRTSAAAGGAVERRCHYFSALKTVATRHGMLDARPMLGSFIAASLVGEYIGIHLLGGGGEERESPGGLR